MTKKDPTFFPLHYLGTVNLVEWLVPPQAKEVQGGKAWQDVWSGESYPTAEEAEQIRADRARGFGFKALMAKYDVSHETLEKILGPREFPKRPPSARLG